MTWVNFMSWTMWFYWGHLSQLSHPNGRRCAKSAFLKVPLPQPDLKKGATSVETNPSVPLRLLSIHLYTVSEQKALDSARSQFGRVPEWSPNGRALAVPGQIPHVLKTLSLGNITVTLKSQHGEGTG